MIIYSELLCKTCLGTSLFELKKERGRGEEKSSLQTQGFSHCLFQWLITYTAENVLLIPTCISIWQAAGCGYFHLPSQGAFHYHI